jgi:hypothetical protein
MLDAKNNALPTAETIRHGKAASKTSTITRTSKARISLANMSPQFNARLAGFLYLLLVPLGFFSMYAGSLVEPGNSVATAQNIMKSEFMFRLSIVSALITPIVNILLVLALYRLLKPVNKAHAAIMVTLVITVAPITMLNQLNHFALLALSGADHTLSFTLAQQKQLIPIFAALHDYGMAIVDIFWGLWLFPLGYLVFKSNFIPKLIGVTLMIACFGYLANSYVMFFLSNHDLNIASYTFWGELFILLWLLIKGIDVGEWERQNASRLKNSNVNKV